MLLRYEHTGTLIEQEPNGNSSSCDWTLGAHSVPQESPSLGLTLLVASPARSQLQRLWTCELIPPGCFHGIPTTPPPLGTGHSPPEAGGMVTAPGNGCTHWPQRPAPKMLGRLFTSQDNKTLWGKGIKYSYRHIAPWEHDRTAFWKTRDICVLLLLGNIMTAW